MIDIQNMPTQNDNIEDEFCVWRVLSVRDCSGLMKWLCFMLRRGVYVNESYKKEASCWN